MEEIKLTLEATYEIRYEEWKDFKKSMFCDEYRKASGIIEEIINNNEKLTKEKNKNNYDEKTNEQVCNVIAFLGGRGSGKSSVLASYCMFLREFCECYSGSYDEAKLDGETISLLEKGKKEKISFKVLKTIDATMLEKKETIVGIILARMLETIEGVEKQRGLNGIGNHGEMTDLGRSIKTDIGKIYEYMHYLAKSDEEEEIPVLKLKAMSNSWNLRSAFKKLVTDCNRYLLSNNNRYDNGPTGKNYIVIPIDDIDMNVEKCREMLEMIRMYLMVPGVILLLTFNYEQLNIVCRNYYIDKLYRKKDPTLNLEVQARHIKELTREYMEKVIPTGRKIYMPHLHQLDGGNMGKQLFIGGIHPDGLKPELSLKTEAYISAMLRFYTGVVCLPDRRNEYICPYSIRQLNNFVKEFLALKKLDINEDKKQNENEADISEWFNKNLDWFYQDVTNRFLQQYVETTERENLRDYLNNVHNEANVVLLEMLLNAKATENTKWRSILRQIDRERLQRGYLCQGDYLLMLHIAKKAHIMSENALLCWHLFLSIKSARIYFNSIFGSTRKDEIGFLCNDSWGVWDDYCWYKEPEDKTAISVVVNELTLPIEVARVDNCKGRITKKKKQEIEDAIKEYLMTRIFLSPYGTGRQNKNQENVLEGNFILGLNKGSGWRFNIGNLLTFVWEYKEYLTLFAKEIEEGIYASSVKEVKEALIQEMDEWKENYNTVELVPFSSTLFMDRILERFYDGQKKEIKQVEMQIKDVLTIMEEELEKIETFKEKEKEDKSKVMSWADILENEKKQKDYATISSCKKAFMNCPIVKVLRSEGTVPENIYAALKNVLDYMANETVAREDSKSADDQTG